MNVIEEIEKLAKLREKGILTDEEFKELKAATLAMDDNAASTKETINTGSIQTNSNLGVNNATTSPKSFYINAIASLLAVLACISLGLLLAQKNNDDGASGESNQKSEAQQKQAEAEEQFAKQMAETQKGAEAIIANSRKSESQSNSETNATPTPEPVSEKQEAQTTQSTEKAPAPATETASIPKEESPPAKSSTDLIKYDSPATPFVIQMIDAARDTEKLFAAKNSLTGLGRPSKGDRKAARKLNDTAIALMSEKKYTEAIPVLQEANKTDPSDIEIMNNLAYARIEEGITENNFTQAKTALVNTLQLKPERAQAWANLGRTFALEGNETAATNCYINFFRFAENKDKALSRLQEGINETNPALSKSLTNAYSYVKSNLQAEAVTEKGDTSQ